MNHYPHLLSDCCSETVGFNNELNLYYCKCCFKKCEPIDTTDPDQLNPEQLKEILQDEKDLIQLRQDYERNLL